MINGPKLVAAEIFHGRSGGLSPVLLRLTADDGVTGLGEAALAYGTGALGAVGMIEDLVRRYLAGGIPAFRGEAVWNEILDHGFWAKGGGAVVFAAMSAIETAMLDIKARTLGVPVYELLGGRMHDSLACYCNGWYFGATRDEDLPRFAESAVADGYDRLKFYPLVEILPEGRLRHPSLRAASEPEVSRRALRRVAEIRRAVGPEVELMLDLSGGLSVGDTIDFCRAVAEHDVSFVEEPTMPGDTGALAQVAGAIPQQVAVGERLYTRNAFRDVLEARAVYILQPDIGNTGGLMEARRIAAMAEAYGLKVQPHVCASAVSSAAAMHLSAALPNFYVQEHFPYWSRLPGHVDVVDDPVEDCVSAGRLSVPDRPGLGVTLRDAAVEDWRVARIDLE